jgi:hypothetical protein
MINHFWIINDITNFFKVWSVVFDYKIIVIITYEVFLYVIFANVFILSCVFELK